MAEEKDKAGFPFYSEAVLLALFSIYAYAITFFYEAGFLRYFNIPPSLIRTSIPIAFVVFLSIIGALVIIFFISNFLMVYWPEDKVIENKVLRIGILFLVLLWKLILFGFSDYQWILCFVIIAVLVLSEFIIPIFRFRDKGSYYEKLKTDDIVEQVQGSRTLTGRINDYLGVYKYLTLILLFIGLWFAYDAGRASALRKEEFLVYGKSSNIVVLRIYDNLMICAPFDKETKVVERKLVFKRVADEPDLMFVNERIGPLKPRKPDEPQK